MPLSSPVNTSSPAEGFIPALARILCNDTPFHIEVLTASRFHGTWVQYLDIASMSRSMVLLKGKFLRTRKVRRSVKPVFHVEASVAGALHGGDNGNRRHGLNFIEGEHKFLVYQTLHLQTIGLRIHICRKEVVWA